MKSIINYLINLFTKKDPFGGESNSYSRMMHNINRIAIVMFFISLIILVIKLFAR